MKNTLKHMQEILNRNISGFHQYVLSDPVHLCFVSQNLCEMTGFSAEDLLSESDDLYAALVHPAEKREQQSAISQRDYSLRIFKIHLRKTAQSNLH